MRLPRLLLKNNDPFVPLLIERKRGETLFANEVTVEGQQTCSVQCAG